MSDPNIYTVGWICAIPTEYVAAQAFLDSDKDRLTGDKLRPAFVHKNDNNNYTLGRIGEHNVVIAVLPKGQYGTTSAAGVARDMLHSFPNIRIGLMVGIGGGAPTEKNDIRLGDIVVSAPQGGYGGVFQYDFGKTIQDREFQATGFLDQPPTVLGTAVSGLMAEYELEGHEIQKSIEEALQRRPRLRQKYGQPDLITDKLYRADVIHPPEAEGECMTSCGSDASLMVARRGREEREDNPTVHHGLVASANQLMKDAVLRDKLALEKDVLCFEMEAAGLMNHFPCLVIRGICDYSDTHKNKQWQGYAAMAAAAYARDVLNIIPQNKVEAEMRLSELLSEIHTDLAGIRGQTSETKAHVEELRADGHHDKIRHWLAAPDPSTNFNKAREQYHEGTGRWLLDSEVYTKWKTEQKTFLWLYGIPGCGKTILSSSVVRDLEQSAGSARTLLYFYFDFNDVDKQSLDKAVRSLIDQLYFKEESARKKMDDLYTSCDRGSRQPDQRSLRVLLQDMLQCQNDSGVWIVLDALDECHARNEGKASDLMSYIKTLRDCTANVHLLVTSRPEHDIRSAIENWARDSEIIPLQSTEVKDDINSYIKAKVTQLSRWQKRPGVQNDIITVLSNKANGMFRWVSCQFDVLSRCLDPDSIHRELARLPRTLDETYERILKSVEPSRRDSAIRLLQFLTYSERPLTLTEAVDAVAVKISKEPNFDPEYRMPCPEEIVAYCSSLAILVKRKDEIHGKEIVEIQLAHFSVQEYLMSDRLQGHIAHELSRSTANTALTTVCLSYLLSLDLSSQADKTMKIYSLAEYSAQYWLTYAAAVENPTRSTIPVVQKFFSSISTINFCCQIYDPDGFRLYSGYRAGKVPKVNALYYAALAGLTYSTQALIGDGANVNVQYGYYGRALLAAIAGGHRETVQILIDNGADIDVQFEQVPEVFMNACYSRQPELIQILIDKGVNVDARGAVFAAALHEASENGHQEIVRVLVNNQADVNALDKCGQTALHLASVNGHNETVRLLIDKGADINARDSNNGNALWAAFDEGHQETFRMLIDKGANVNAQNHKGDSPLQAAASQGNTSIVQLLIDNGADINFQGGKHGNALQIASARGYKEVVQLLINNGVDPSVEGGEHGNGLQIASARGYKEVVQLFINNGVDVNVQGGEHGNALQIASAQGYEEIVQLLIDNGVDVNARDEFCNTALQAAAVQGHVAIVKMLIDQGADVNAQGGYFDNALSAASHQGHKAIVKILLDQGADVNAVGKRFGNAVQAATEVNLFGYVLEAATEGKRFGNALQAAANDLCFRPHIEGRQQEIIKMLIQFKRNQDGRYFETLMAHSLTFHKEQNESNQGELMQPNKRRSFDHSQESIAKRPHL